MSVEFATNRNVRSLREETKPSKALPRVSVLMITYNHERFISQAIESVLEQRTDFEYELVIGEDCSTDSTRDIVIEYQRRHPHRIRLLLPCQNLGMINNFITTLRACRGEYIAILEGDDYWTCSNKLQRQVDFLDNNPDTVICCHQVTEFFEDGSGPTVVRPSGHCRPISEIDDLISQNFIVTCSSIFRKDAVGHLPDWYFDLKMGDWPLFVLISQRGQIGFIPEIMAAYRVHSGGAWCGTHPITQLYNIVGFYTHLKTGIDSRYLPLIESKIARCYFAFALEFQKVGKIKEARRYARQCAKSTFSGGGVSLVNLVKLLCRLYGGKTYALARRYWRSLRPRRA